MKPQDPDELTRREREVRDLVDRGLTNEEIAGHLGISTPGVKYHVSQILSKLGLGSRREVGGRRNWAGIAWRAVLGVGAAVAVVALVVLGIGILLTDSDDGEHAIAWDGPVYIESISPSSGTIGTEVEIRGYGFTPGGNDVGFAAKTTDASPQFGETAYHSNVPSPDGETLHLELQETLGACAMSQTGGCIAIGLSLPTGEVSVSVHNRNGTSNSVLFTREISRLEAAEDEIHSSPEYEQLIRFLNDLVSSTDRLPSGLYPVSVGSGVHESADGEIYLDVTVHGADVDDIEEHIPSEIAGYEVRLQIN